MFSEWKTRRAAKRVQPGTGRPLKPFRWWQQLGRALFYLPATPAGPEYAVDVPHWGNHGSGEVKAHLYRDGRHHAESKVPAVFSVESGRIEVATSAFGLKRCHLVADDGRAATLVPDRRSAEGRRLNLQRTRPEVSRLIGVLSVFILLGGVALLALQLIDTLTDVPPIAESIGDFTSPVRLPLWLSIGVGLVTAMASTERALRLRYHWLLDAAGN